LDIWEGLQDRARQEGGSIGGKTVADVAERTSKSVGGDTDGGALFDETASWYARLRDRSEKIIVDTLNSNVREALRPYRSMYVAQTSNASVELSVQPILTFSSSPAILGRRSAAPRQPRPRAPIFRLLRKSTHFSRTWAPLWGFCRALLRRRPCAASLERH
jgi:hypothetical protein